MKRIEVILTQAIEEDFVNLYEAACKGKNIKCNYTKIDNIMGQANSNPKMGDSVWPQLNVMFVIYCDESLVEVIQNIMKELHKTYVGEGAAAFMTDATALV